MEKNKVNRRNFLLRGSLASGGLLALIGCDKKTDELAFKDQTRETVMKTDPALIKWKRTNSWPVQMENATNIHVLSSGALVICGKTGLEQVKVPGREADTYIPSKKELYVDFLELPGGNGYITAKRQSLMRHEKGGDGEGTQMAFLSDEAMITAISTDGDNILIADAGSHRFWAFNFDGQLVAKWGQKNERLSEPGLIIPSPYLDITVDSGNNIWGVNPGRHSIVRYSPNGEVQEKWGHASTRVEGFCGCCNPTHLIALPDGNGFLTCEKGIARVKHYSREGELLGVVVPPEDFELGTQSLAIAAATMDEIFVLHGKDQILYQYTKKA